MTIPVKSPDEPAVDKGRVDLTRASTPPGHTSGFNGKIQWVQIDLEQDATDADHGLAPGRTPPHRYGAAVICATETATLKGRGRPTSKRIG